MALPEFNSEGDLPEGLHRATLDDVRERFGNGSPARKEVTLVLERVFRLAIATRKLERFVIFGSYVTAKVTPRDVDVVLVMSDDFSLKSCAEATRTLFDHPRAQQELGASVFWVKPSALLGEPLDRFLLGWGTKRGQGIRGIVEVSR
jgi:hypothetical protein